MYSEELYKTNKEHAEKLKKILTNNTNAHRMPNTDHKKKKKKNKGLEFTCQQEVSEMG